MQILRCIDEDIDIALNICYTLVYKRGRKATAPYLHKEMATLIQEKRIFPRVRIHTPLRYQVRGWPQHYNTLSKDLGLGGISLTHDKFIARNTPLMLEIRLLSQVLHPIGKVRWAQHLPFSERYHIGIQFVEFEAKEKRFLSDYIDMQKGVF